MEILLWVFALAVVWVPLGMLIYIQTHPLDDGDDEE